ncbi:hypothetical protein ACLOJK_036538 [Asimina triloba]
MCIAPPEHTIRCSIIFKSWQPWPFQKPITGSNDEAGGASPLDQASRLVGGVTGSSNRPFPSSSGSVEIPKSASMAAPCSSLKSDDDQQLGIADPGDGRFQQVNAYSVKQWMIRAMASSSGPPNQQRQWKGSNNRSTSTVAAADRAERGQHAGNSKSQSTADSQIRRAASSHDHLKSRPNPAPSASGQQQQLGFETQHCQQKSRPNSSTIIHMEADEYV